MTIELSKAQQTVLKETSPAVTPAELQRLLDEAKPEMDRIVREVMVPNRPIDVVVTELRDLVLAIDTNKSALATVGFVEARCQQLYGAVRLLATAALWFGEGTRTGAFRARSVGEIVQASRPWRARLKAYAEQAFAFEPDVAAELADVNSTGTLDEEREDLRVLCALVDEHQERLAAVGMKPAFVVEGKALLEEANGRDLLGILGMRNQEEAALLRNRIFTYATLLGREARAAGINACFDDAEARRRFEAASFRNAMRKLRVRKPRTTGGNGAPNEAPKGGDAGPKGGEGTPQGPAPA